MSEADGRFDAAATLLQLEREARHAPDEPALRFVIVNRTRTLLEYRQAVLARLDADNRLRVVAVSGVPELDRNAPFIRWQERMLRCLLPVDSKDSPLPRAVTAEDVDARDAREWPEWSASHGLWCPLVEGDGRQVGGLWLSRERPWAEAEKMLAGQLADCYAHAWAALGRRRRFNRLVALPRRRTVVIAAVIAASLLFVRVRESVLAPAEVVPHDPVIVAAPLQAVIAGFDVKPNQLVKKGQELFHFDDTRFQAKYQVAEKSLSVARAELLEASQSAFSSAKSSAQTGILRARIALRTAERDYAQQQLQRTVVRAGRSGIAVYTDPDDWVGKPVVVGERIMQLADPKDTRLRIDLPVANAISLKRGTEVVLFLDTAPLHPLHATVTRASYAAEPTSGGVLAYRIYARFASGTSPPRIGLQGTARIYGGRVALAYYLLRRPISTVRRWFGL